MHAHAFSSQHPAAYGAAPPANVAQFAPPYAHPGGSQQAASGPMPSTSPMPMTHSGAPYPYPYPYAPPPMHYPAGIAPPMFPGAYPGYHGYSPMGGSPVPSTAGPYAGAAVQTSTQKSGNGNGGSSGSQTSSADEKSPAAGHATSGWGSDGNSNSNAPGHSASARGGASFDGAFDASCSNRAITESRQLVVKFLTDDTNEKQFRELFERFGPVENARIIYDRKTQHTKGFGFITFRRAEHAVQALRTMGGYHLHGRQLNVALAQTERKRGFSSQELAPPPALQQRHNGQSPAQPSQQQQQQQQQGQYTPQQQPAAPPHAFFFGQQPYPPLGPSEPTP